MGPALARGKLTAPAPARAELIEDAGAASSSEEFFRSLELIAAEGVTHSLRIEGEGIGLVAPLVVREVPAGGLDAVSPYGCPGVVPATAPAPSSPELAGPEPPLDPAAVDWSATGLVSAFIRGTALGPHPLAGAARSTLQISDPALPPKSRMSDRQQIRRNEAAGYASRVVPGPESDRAELAGFRRAYEQTMVRTGASRRYFFDRAWFEAVLGSARSWLAIVDGPQGGVAAASIAVLSDGVLHYFLSGTADEHLRQAPMKNLLVALQDLSSERRAPLNLGGGLRPGDGLEEFKRGFANREAPFVTHEVVCDAAAYERLSAGRPASGFFPAYRAPA